MPVTTNTTATTTSTTAPVPPSIYEQLIQKCHDGKTERNNSNKKNVIRTSKNSGSSSRTSALKASTAGGSSSSQEVRKQLALEAFKMYWSDAVEGQGLPPAHTILYRMLEVSR